MADNGMTLGMRSLWEQGQLLNFNIYLEGSSFQVHKVVMMANSDFFKSMFTGAAAENPKDDVKVEGVSAVAMEILIHFMYTNEMNLTKENAAEVLAGAMFLQIIRAVKFCTQFIIGSLEIDTCRDVLLLFRSYDLTEASEQVISYMKKNVWKMVKTVDHFKLALSELHFYVENWQGSEWELFCFIKYWVRADAEKREEHLDGLLSCVRYCLMTLDELEDIKQMQCYQCTFDTWSHLVDKAIKYHKLPANLKVLHGSEQAKVRSAPTFVLFTGEQSVFGGYIYDSQKKCLIEDKALKTPEGYYLCRGEVDINNYLVICTASERHYGKESWYIYDPRNGIWFKMADLPRTMEAPYLGLTGSNPSVLTHDNKHLYAVRESIERYDFKTNSWSDFSRMPLEVHFFGAGVCKNGLYVCGGRKPYNPVSQAVNKNESQDEKESLQDTDSSYEESDDSSQEKDDEPVVEAHYPGPEYSNRMDRLDLSTLQWESKAPMLKYHRDHSLYTMKVFGEEVICIFNNVTDMEYYNPSADQWSTCSFTLNVPLPIQPDRDDWVHEGPNRWCKGSKHFLADINLAKKFGREKNAYVTVTYPEEGTAAVIDFLCEYEGQFQQLSQTKSLKGEVDPESYVIYQCGGGREKQHCHPTVACFPARTK